MQSFIAFCVSRFKFPDEKSTLNTDAIIAVAYLHGGFSEKGKYLGFQIGFKNWLAILGFTFGLIAVCLECF